MPNFGLIRSFDIDNDELAALTPQECFVLGYELAQIDQLLESSRQFTGSCMLITPIESLRHARTREGDISSPGYREMHQNHG